MQPSHQRHVNPLCHEHHFIALDHHQPSVFSPALVSTMFTLSSLGVLIIFRIFITLPHPWLPACLCRLPSLSQPACLHHLPSLQHYHLLVIMSVYLSYYAALCTSAANRRMYDYNIRLLRLLLWSLLSSFFVKSSLHHELERGVELYHVLGLD